MTQTLVHSMPPASKEKLDQFFTEPNNLGSVINDAAAYIAQTYTARINGRLAGVSIDVRSKRGLDPDRGFNYYQLHVALCVVRNGFPGAALTETMLDTDEAQIDKVIRFPDAVPQVAGTQYAIVVHYADAPPAGPGQWIGIWQGATGNIYPDGELCNGPDGKIWFIGSLNNFDAHFRTYVIPSEGME